MFEVILNREIPHFSVHLKILNLEEKSLNLTEGK